MSHELDHITLANRNHDALVYLAKEARSHPEWVATVAFYKAVQVVEAVLDADCRRHSNGHDARIDSLKHPKYRELFIAYRPLYAASLVARYLEDSSARKFDPKAGKSAKYHHFIEYMPAELVLPRLVQRRLATVEKYALSFLSDDSRKLLKRVEHESFDG